MSKRDLAILLHELDPAIIRAEAELARGSGYCDLPERIVRKLLSAARYARECAQAER